MFLSIISELYEKALVDSVKAVIENRNIITKHQFGFRNFDSKVSSSSYHRRN